MQLDISNDIAPVTKWKSVISLTLLFEYGRFETVYDDVFVEKLFVCVRHSLFTTTEAQKRTFCGNIDAIVVNYPFESSLKRISGIFSSWTATRRSFSVDTILHRLRV